MHVEHKQPHPPPLIAPCLQAQVRGIASRCTGAAGVEPRTVTILELAEEMLPILALLLLSPLKLPAPLCSWPHTL